MLTWFVCIYTHFQYSFLVLEMGFGRGLIFISSNYVVGTTHTHCIFSCAYILNWYFPISASSEMLSCHLQHTQQSLFVFSHAASCDCTTWEHSNYLPSFLLNKLKESCFIHPHFKMVCNKLWYSILHSIYHLKTSFLYMYMDVDRHPQSDVIFIPISGKQSTYMYILQLSTGMCTWLIRLIYK